MSFIHSEKIMLVDDEKNILSTYEYILQGFGYPNVVLCGDSRNATSLVETEQPDLVLLDLTMPHITGEELLQGLVRAHPELPIIIVTGDDDVSKVISCIKIGAFDFLIKPVENERLLVTVEQALNTRAIARENTRLREGLLHRELKSPEAFEAFVTNNDQVLAIFRYVEAISVTDKPVLICGETGTGKELMARAVHKASGRGGAFVAVNVAGLDDMVFTDTLFGHLKGAFTGAEMVRRGMVEQAEGGTLFLDEIGDLNQASQVKLLRLLQEQEYLPLGADHPKRTSARFVAATNGDLLQLSLSGKFRADLYFRLNSHAITLPPLRDRKDDLPVLLDFFMEK
ncbi:MAG: sigma-54 dependent transcriptional regulator, partial [Deltaproteobacteria bacterium]|nr:sigma-54 dependent transcriptional regulator [Deltaproteobacteria bacterium]